jgi:hypothetical protein
MDTQQGELRILILFFKKKENRLKTRKVFKNVSWDVCRPGFKRGNFRMRSRSFFFSFCLCVPWVRRDMYESPFAKSRIDAKSGHRGDVARDNGTASWGGRMRL